MYVTIATIAYTATKIKIKIPKEDNVQYWLGEHLLEVYSVHQHGEGELMEPDTIEMQKNTVQ